MSHEGGVGVLVGPPRSGTRTTRGLQSCWRYPAVADADHSRAVSFAGTCFMVPWGGP